MNIILVGLPEELQGKCRDALQSYGHDLMTEPSMESALAGIESRPSNRALPQMLILGPLPPVATMMAVRSVRAHPLAGTAGILVVNPQFGPDESASVLDSGADDCYTRSFLPAIFSARVRGILRRPRGAGPPPAEDKDLLRLGLVLSLHQLRREVKVDGVLTALSRREFDLLASLLGNKPNPVGAKSLMAVMGKSLLHVTPAHLRKELDSLRGKLGRLGSLLSEGPDGSVKLDEALLPPRP